MTEDIEPLKAQLAREVDLRRRLIDIARHLTTTFNRDELIPMIIADAADLIGAETASVLEV
ncbi:MAG TPA: hypothetical protein VMM13_07405, partial [Euzebya sp.]|nr:hypothetical protein [Euzebya sp.]